MPVSHLLISAVFGIVASNCADLDVSIVLLFSLVLLLIYLLIYYLHFTRPGKGSLLSGFLFTLIISMIFYVQACKRNPQINDLPSSWYFYEVISFPQNKGERVRMHLKLIYKQGDSCYLKNRSKTMAYGDSIIDSMKLTPGDRILTKCRPEIFRNNGNPEEFDYAAYQKRRDVYYCIYLKSDSTHVFRKNKIQLIYYPLYVRAHLKHHILDVCNNRDASSVLIAITLGTKEFLHRELKDSYANAGGIHVMAVSGLHVGMIWMFLSFFMKVFGRKRVSVIIRTILIVFALWFYAMLTGLSPSVTRSTLMFSILSLGNLLKRDSSVYNTLMLAAFIQLFVNPGLLYDPGFQFSYLAVFSIVYFHPVICSFLPVKAYIPGKVVDLAAVSISAQILTFPLAVFYFHRFPVFFLLTNFVVIPMVTIIMILFLCSCILVWLPQIYEFLVQLMEFVVDKMNRAVIFIDSVPGSVRSDLYLSQSQLFVLLLSVSFFILFREYKKFKYLILLQLGLFLVPAEGFLHLLRQNDNEELRIYNCKNAFCAGMNINDGNYLLVNDIKQNDSLSIYYATESYRIKKRLPQANFIEVDRAEAICPGVYGRLLPDSANSIWYVGNKSFFVLRNMNLLERWKTPDIIVADILIIADPKIRELNSIGDYVMAGTYVLSSVLPSWNKPEIPVENAIQVIDVRLDGSYSVRIN